MDLEEFARSFMQYRNSSVDWTYEYLTSEELQSLVGNSKDIYNITIVKYAEGWVVFKPKYRV